MRHHFEALQKTRANHVPLSPLSFLRRAESLHGARTAVIYGAIRRSWAETSARIRAVAGGLVGLGVQKGDTVSVLSPNTPELFELHFALPLTGAVLNTLTVKGTAADGRALVLWQRLDQAQEAVPPAGELIKLLCEVS